LLQIISTNTFEKDVKRSVRRGKDISKLRDIMTLLAEEESLPINNRDHALRGKYANRRECHIEPDWLLIYKKEETKIIFERTGTHSDLFRT
jgi:mRNA interferase YafQ